jgi:hypothetical protein
MITLISKESHQIKFPGGSIQWHPLPHPLPVTVTVETGVAVFALLGTNPHDWTRDTLVFPVGASGPASDFISGIASAAPTSFWTPMNNLVTGTETISVTVSGNDSAGRFLQLSGGGTAVIPVPPPVGFAIDSAKVAYSTQAGQPVLTLALAVFGNCAAMLRASYTVFVTNSSGGVVVDPPRNE